MWNEQIIGVGALAVFSLLVLWATRGWRRRRREALSRVAGLLGFTYEPRTRLFVIPEAKKFKILRRGGVVDELMRGKLEGRPVTVFRYIVIVHYGYGASMSSWRIAAFQSAASLPTFHMHPQTWVTRLKHRLKAKEIIFETHPEVTRRFYITGPDKAAAAKFFDGQVLSQLTTLPVSYFHAEASGHWLLIYSRLRKFPKPENIPAFLENAGRLANIFLGPVRAQVRDSFGRAS